MSDTDTVTQKQTRSPAYPAFDLASAIEKARKVYGTQKRFSMPVDAVKRTLGFSPKSSNAQRALAALVSYGLLEEEGHTNGRTAKISELAFKILELKPEDHPDRLLAISEAASKPAIYRHMLEEWGGVLPPDTVIENHLKFKKDYNPDIIEGLIRDFRSTVEMANLGIGGILSEQKPESGNDSGDGVGNGQNSQPGGRPPATWLSVKMPEINFTNPASVLSDQKPRETPPMTLNPSEIQTFTLPMYGGRVAMLQAPTNLSLEDAELLEASFQIIKKTLIARESLNASSVQEIPFITAGSAVWRTKDGDMPIVILGYRGRTNGRDFVNIEGSAAGVPLDEVVSISETN